MTPKAEIKDGRFQLTAVGKVYREQSEADENIRTAAELNESHWSSAPHPQIEVAKKNGLSHEEAMSALYVLAWPTTGGGSGQWITIRETSSIYPEVSALRESRKQVADAVADAKKHEVEIRLSSRGWGDLSPLTITVDRRETDQAILAKCRESLEPGHDIDERDQSDADLLARIATAKGAEKKALTEQVETLAAKLGKLDPEKMVETEAEARKSEQRYNNVMNEGGEGYVPRFWSRESFDAETEKLEDLRAKLNQMEA